MVYAIAKKHTISELCKLFNVSKTPMYEICRKYEIEYVAGECEEATIARRSKPVERVEPLVLFTCDSCKEKKTSWFQALLYKKEKNKILFFLGKSA